jgi:hypothetical protein
MYARATYDAGARRKGRGRAHLRAWDSGAHTIPALQLDVHPLVSFIGGVAVATRWRDGPPSSSASNRWCQARDMTCTDRWVALRLPDDAPVDSPSGCSDLERPRNALAELL